MKKIIIISWLVLIILSFSVLAVEDILGVTYNNVGSTLTQFGVLFVPNSNLTNVNVIIQAGCTASRLRVWNYPSWNLIGTESIYANHSVPLHVNLTKGLSYVIDADASGSAYQRYTTSAPSLSYPANRTNIEITGGTDGQVSEGYIGNIYSIFSDVIIAPPDYMHLYPYFFDNTPANGSTLRLQAGLNFSCNTTANLRLFYGSNLSNLPEVSASNNSAGSISYLTNSPNGTYYYYGSCNNSVNSLTYTLFEQNASYLNVTSYIPPYLHVNISENNSLQFIVTSTGGGTTFFTWFLDGVKQAFVNTWTWIIGFVEGNLDNPHNVTIIVNNSYGDEQVLAWTINVSNVGTLFDLQLSSSNVSYYYNNVTIYCLFNATNSWANISYKSPSGEWTLIDSQYNSTMQAYYTKLEFTPASETGYYDIKCLARDLDMGVNYSQINYNALNIYAVNLPPDMPVLLFPQSGSYDTSITINCGGSEDLNGDIVYYDILAGYINPENQQVTQFIEYNDSTMPFKWSVINLPEQDNISYSCRAYDGQSYSSYYSPSMNLSIRHGANLVMFEANLDRDYFINGNIILDVYCSTETMKNTKIIGTWADCNNDGQWDYYYDYDKLSHQLGKNIKKSDDFFTCRYPDAGNKIVIVGCVMEKDNADLPQDVEFCKEQASAGDYCNAQKMYVVEVKDI